MKPETGRENGRPRIRRYMKWLPILVLAAVLAAAGFKGWRIYQKGLVVYRDMTSLRALADGPVSAMDLETVSTALDDFQHSLGGFEGEVQPFTWLAPGLGWLPVHGGDIANAADLIELADLVADASSLSLEAARPLLRGIETQTSGLDPASVTRLLVDAQPRLLEARGALDRALEVRSRLEVERLSPRLQGLVLDDLDPLLVMMDDGLSLSTALPFVLGADGSGPKTYLLLVQNEDELRPSGGFITTVGRLVVQDGRILSLDFEGVDEEDWSRPYPAAPWQLQEYMNAGVLILRDSNWFADFPTSALWAEYLYGYDHPDTLDGVVAFDQHFLVLLLGVLGPLEVEGAPYAITDGNVIEYMRSAKAPPAEGPVPPDWYRKGFIEDIADALVQELAGGEIRDWRGLAGVLGRALEERHLLLYFNEPEVSSLLSRRGWDNAVRPIDGDFLMVTDTNIGFNKTNALVDAGLSYTVNLTDPSSPTANLIVHHRNAADDGIPCIQWGFRPVEEEADWYPMNRCYWNYLRVYKQAGVELRDASPHVIPADWMLLERRVPARVDDLEEDIPGVRGFGTLVVVPGGRSLDTGFDLDLPPSAVSRDEDTGRYTYRLKVQKQPGTLADPLVIRVHLPNGAGVESINLQAVGAGDSLLIETDLRTDVYLELVFHVP